MCVSSIDLEPHVLGSDCPEPQYTDLKNLSCQYYGPRFLCRIIVEDTPQLDLNTISVVFKASMSSPESTPCGWQA